MHNKWQWRKIILIILAIVLGIAIIGGVIFYFLFYNKKQVSASSENHNTKANDIEITLADKESN